MGTFPTQARGQVGTHTSTLAGIQTRKLVETHTPSREVPWVINHTVNRAQATCNMGDGMAVAAQENEDCILLGGPNIAVAAACAWSGTRASSIVKTDFKEPRVLVRARELSRNSKCLRTVCCCRRRLIPTLDCPCKLRPHTAS